MTKTRWLNVCLMFDHDFILYNIDCSVAINSP